VTPAAAKKPKDGTKDSAKANRAREKTAKPGKQKDKKAEAKVGAKAGSKPTLVAVPKAVATAAGRKSPAALTNGNGARPPGKPAMAVDMDMAAASQPPSKASGSRRKPARA
jgi:hypothetical protein